MRPNEIMRPPHMSSLFRLIYEHCKESNGEKNLKIEMKSIEAVVEEKFEKAVGKILLYTWCFSREIANLARSAPFNYRDKIEIAHSLARNLLDTLL